MSVFISEKQTQAKAASLLLAQRVRNFFKEEENRRKFEDWYKEQNGKQYQWKKVTT